MSNDRDASYYNPLIHTKKSKQETQKNNLAQSGCLLDKATEHDFLT